MSKRYMIVFAMTVCACSVLASGCRSKSGPKAGDDLDKLVTDEIPGDVRLNDRESFGALGEPINVPGLENVLFAYDSYKVSDSETAKIDKVADYMKANSKVRLVTDGHCDERGSSEYNQVLGEHRALAVRAYLVGKGIDASLMQTRSYGKDKPLDPGHNDAAWRVNRRVEFKLYK